MQLISRTSRRFTHHALSRRLDASLSIACAFAIACGATACASAPKSSGASAAASSSPGGPKSSPNLITADEISRVSVQNAFEAIQKLRPAMLRQRQIASANGQGGMAQNAPAVTGTGVSSGQVVVYMDGTRLGDTEQLRQISATSVSSVRYYSASEAQTKWGSGHPGGAIEVVTKR